MKSDTQKSLIELLNEEKWTRETINSYSLKNFKLLNSIIDEAKRTGEAQQIRHVCSEHLHHTPQSIHAQYVVGKMDLEHEGSDEGKLEKLIDLFSKNKRYAVVEYLSNEVLKYGENTLALEALASSMQNSKSNGKLISIWERLVKVKRDDAKLARKLGNVKEQHGKLDEAVQYYKTALFRFLKKGRKIRVEEMWRKLVELVPEDLSLYFNLERRIKESLGSERFASLLALLLTHYKEKGDLATAIKLLKIVIANNSTDSAARRELVDCYKQQYKKHAQLQKYLDLSGLDDSATNIQDAIDVFEKHIRFDIDTHVYHRRWGLGICRKIEGDDLIIDFQAKPNHRMNLQMAATCLEIVPEDHIWLLKARDPRKLRNLILSNVEEGVRLVIKSKGNAATVKDFKEELCGSVLKKSEWSGWWSKARKVLKSNLYFGETVEGEGHFFIRESPIPLDEDIYLKFQKEKDFDVKCNLFIDFVKEGFVDSDYIDEMLKFFFGFLQSPEKLSIHGLKSYLLLQWFRRTQGYLPDSLPYDFSTIVEHVENIHRFFPTITSSDMKKSFLHNMRRSTADWPSIFIYCFYLDPFRFILDELITHEKQQLVETTVRNIVSHYRENTDLFVWVGRNVLGRKIESQININIDRVIMGYIHILEITNRELVNEHNVAQNRKIFNSIVKILCKDNFLMRYIKSAGERDIRKLIPVIMSLSELGNRYKIQVKFTIKSFHPDIVFNEDIEEVERGKKFLVTRESYEWKQDELTYLREEGVPFSDRNVDEKREEGHDLSNVECPDAQPGLDVLREHAKRLEEDLKRAQVLRPSDVDTSFVSVGTAVTLNSIDRKKTQKYTILGPWDADPSEKIVSYTSSVGKKLINKSEGDEVELEEHGGKKRFIIKKVEKAVY